MYIVGSVFSALIIIFFFFYRRYNPLWVLTFSVIFFHSTLSFHNFLHHLILIICISSSMSSIHLFLGLLLFLLPIGFHSINLLGILFFFHPHHVTQPSHSFPFYKSYYMIAEFKQVKLYLKISLMLILDKVQ